MKFSKLLKVENIDKQKAFLLGMIYAWPVFSKDIKLILAYSSYKIDSSPRMSSILEFNSIYYIEKHLNKLKKFLGNEYLVLTNDLVKKNFGNFDRQIGGGVSVLIENDILVDKKEMVYGVIEKWLIDIDDEFKKYFLIGFMESRGSLDFTGKFYTIDLTQKNLPEIAKRKLNRLNDILGMVYNYNPRVLQEKSFKKNDQFRINLDYYAGHYGFFRPHIIEYYEKEMNTKLTCNFICIDDNFKNKELSVNAKNFEINEFAISIKGLSKEEKIKKVQEYKMEKFDFDTEDEILYSSYNTKEKAKANADYICEFDHNHITFTSKSTNKLYVEAHHLIPFSKRKEFDVSIDIEENLVALCPICHRKIHLAKDKEREKLIKTLFDSRKEKLKKEMIDIDINNLYRMYNLKK